MNNIATKTLAQLIELFRAGDVSSRQITESFIAEIEAKNDDINAFVTTTFDRAREQADAADARRANDDLLSPIDGMPMGIKDIICTKGVRTTACSKMLENFIPPYNATVTQKLLDAGAVLLGKLNTDEFAMGASSEFSAFGVTRNPHDLTRVAGGSSGGPAAAVAANMAAFTIGTDTGGSIRLPASFCGVAGLKVSYGRVSRYGVMAMASSLDTVGPFAKTAEDCSIIMEIIAGQDIRDATTVPDTNTKTYRTELNDSLKGLRVGIPKEYFTDELGEETRQVVESARQILDDLGCEFVPVSLPHTKYAVPTYYIVVPSEVSANMARYDGIRYGEGIPEGKDLQEIYTESRSAGFGEEVKRRIMLGTFALSAGYADQFYKQAQKVRTLIKQDFDETFKQVDVLLTPCFTGPAFKIGEKSDDPVAMYMADIFMAPASLAGVSGVSVPVGNTKYGLPIGVQIIGPSLGEGSVLRVAHQIEQEL